MAQDPNQVDTAAIRAQIERTRDELGSTIDAIQERLSLRRVVHEAKESIVGATVGRARRLAHQVTDAVHSGQAGSNVSAVMDQARNNPTVTALIGSAATALVFALAARSRRPRLAMGLGGLAVSLAMAGAARSRSDRHRAAEPYPGDVRGRVNVYETPPALGAPRESPPLRADTLLPATD
jgi:hypothetical protein